jgi:hypothetical protein
MTALGPDSLDHPQFGGVLAPSGEFDAIKARRSTRGDARSPQ